MKSTTMELYYTDTGINVDETRCIKIYISAVSL